MLSRFLFCSIIVIPAWTFADSSLGNLNIDLSDSTHYVKAGSYDDSDLYLFKTSIRADSRQATGTKGLSLFLIRDYRNNYTQDTIRKVDGSIKKSGIFYNRAAVDTSINCLSKEFTANRTALIRDGEIVEDRSSEIYWIKAPIGTPYRKAIDLACSIGSKYL